MPAGDRVLLLTGFPGFLGTRLTARLLADDPGARLVALVEPRMLARAREVAGGLEAADRVEIVAGNIAERRLGLGRAAHERLTRTVTQVFHLAAIYDLAVPAELAERVNVDGTQHVVAFCRACERLERHDYVSTAYTAGDRSGRVFEDELAAGQGFKNHYESTKFAAEVIVRGAMDEIPTAIHRPAIVVGDSRTGATQKFDGPYYLLRMISLCARRHVPIPQLGSAAATFNVVPVDFVIAAMAAVSRDPAALGRTLHLTDRAPLQSAELLRVLAQAYAGREPSIRVPPGLVERLLGHATFRRLVAGTPRESLVYLNHPVTFDTANADAILGAHGLACPRFADYAGVITEFFREHERDPAFAAVR